MSQGAEQIRAHSGLRGVAALLVVAYHLQFSAPRLWIEDATDFFRRGYLFVDLFFMLSGFILSYVGDADRPRPLTWARYRDFIGRRFVRLYPLLAFTLIALFVYRYTYTYICHSVGRGSPYPWDERSLTILAAQATMTNAWMADPGQWNLPSWSISAEMFAYLLFPFLVVFRARWPRCGAVLLALTPIGFYGWITATTGSLDIIGGTAPLRCLAGFTLGMLVHVGRHRFARLPDRALTPLQIVAAVATLVLLALPVNDCLLIPPFVLLVATTWTDRGPLSRLLGLPTLQYLGMISYSVYLVHVPILETLDLPWDSFLRHGQPPEVAGRIAWIVIGGGTTLWAAGITYRWIEVPGRQFLSRRLLGHPLGTIRHSPPAP